MIELLLVLALVALMGLLVAGMVGGGSERGQFHSTAKQFAAGLRDARTRAMASGESRRVSIDMQERTWLDADGRMRPIPAHLDVILTSASEVRGKDTDGVIVFFADGTSTGGRLMVRWQGAAWHIDVAWLTGEVRLRREDAP